MSNLDFIRSVRHALSGLRDARDPSAVNAVARALADELEAKLRQHAASRPRELEPDIGMERAREIGMAVYA